MSCQAERCGYFQWQDQPSTGPTAQKQHNHGPHDLEEFAPDSDNGPEVQCECGLPAKELTSHSIKNPNRVFYKCPKPQVGVSWLLTRPP